ncbi:MAG: ParB/RepB/Spo0J family partition protein [Nitrososphaerales archaeon]|jgi:ParB family chromosome partitioning protein
MGRAEGMVDDLVSLPVTLLPIVHIRPSKFKLRRELGRLDELEESISRVGLLQPIIVRKKGSQSYEVVSGHRRLASCRALGMKSIRAIITEMGDKTSFEVQLTENIQRESFAPLEEARAFYSYVGSGRKGRVAYGTVSELARRIGKSQEYISNRMRLLRLPVRLMEKMFVADGFTVSHAEEISLLASNPELVEKLCDMVVAKKITVRELERAIPLIKSGTEVEPAIELARNEVKLRPKREAQLEVEDSVGIILRRTRKLLESTLCYVDSAGVEMEMDRDLHEIWIREVRMKIHDAVDGVVFAERVRRGKRAEHRRRPTEEPFIWSG